MIIEYISEYMSDHRSVIFW